MKAPAVRTIAVVISLAFLSATTLTQGALIAGHFGATDPTSEGFVLLQSGAPLLVPLVEDLGLSAWSIHLDTSADIAEYSRTLTASEQLALRDGWVMSLSVRVLEPFDQPSGAIHAYIRTGTETFPFVLLGAQADGDPIVRVGASEYALEGAGPGYHNYELSYDSDVGLASLSVDGSLLTGDIAGAPYPAPAKFSWGGAQHSSGSAYANWNEASLWAIPEPSAFALLGFAGLLFAGRAMRRRRSGPETRFGASRKSGCIGNQRCGFRLRRCVVGDYS